MSIALTIGERIEDLIKNKGGSVTGDAKKMNISQCTLSEIINGKRENIGSDTIKKLCAYYNVSSDYILGLSEIPTRNETIQGINEKTGLSQNAINTLIIEKTCKEVALIDFISFLTTKRDDILLLIKAILNANRFKHTNDICHMDMGKNCEFELNMSAIFQTYANNIFWDIVSQYEIDEGDGNDTK